MDIVSIIGVILAVVTGLFGTKWISVKKAAKEIVEVAQMVIDAVEDDKVTEEEVKRVVKEAKKVINKKKV